MSIPEFKLRSHKHCLKWNSIVYNIIIKGQHNSNYWWRHQFIYNINKEKKRKLIISQLFYLAFDSSTGLGRASSSFVGPFTLTSFLKLFPSSTSLILGSSMSFETNSFTVTPMSICPLTKTWPTSCKHIYLFLVAP